MGPTRLVRFGLCSSGSCVLVKFESWQWGAWKVGVVVCEVVFHSDLLDTRVVDQSVWAARFLKMRISKNHIELP